MQLFYLIVSHSGVWRTSDMIIVFNIFGVSRAELENSARISSVALICVCGLVVDHFIFCAAGLFRVNDVYCVTSYYCIVVCQLF